MFSLTPRRLLVVVAVLSPRRQWVVVIPTATFLNHYVLKAGMQTSLEKIRHKSTDKPSIPHCSDL